MGIEVGERRRAGRRKEWMMVERSLLYDFSFNNNWWNQCDFWEERRESLERKGRGERGEGRGREEGGRRISWGEREKEKKEIEPLSLSSG